MPAGALPPGPVLREITPGRMPLYGERMKLQKPVAFTGSKAILATPPAPFILYRNRGIPAEGFFVRCDGGRYSEGFPLSSGTVTLSEVR